MIEFINNEDDNKEEELQQKFFNHKLNITERLKQKFQDFSIVGEPDIGKGSLNLKNLKDPFEGYFATKYGKWVQQTGYEKYANLLAERTTITIQDIQQGPIGSCYLLAAFGSILQFNQGSIYMDSMMGNLGKDHIWVRFWTQDDKDLNKFVPIIIIMKNSLPQFIFRLHAYHRDTAWFAYIEKAYAILRMYINGTSSYSGVSGGIGEFTYPHIYGAEASHIMLSDPELIAQHLKAFFRILPYHPMTLSFHRDFLYTSRKENIYSLEYYKHHAYTVMDYDQHNNLVQLYNPWGKGAKMNSQWMPLDCIKIHGEAICYGTAFNIKDLLNKVEAIQNEPIKCVYVNQSKRIETLDLSI